MPQKQCKGLDYFHAGGMKLEAKSLALGTEPHKTETAQDELST